MLVVTDTPRFTHDVDVYVPVDGGFETQTFKATFNVIETSELKEMRKTLGDNDDPVFLERILHSASDLIGLDKQPVSFNAKIKSKMINTPYIANALILAYWKGLAGAKEGN